MSALRYLGPEEASTAAELRRSGDRVLRLIRRGIDHGYVARGTEPLPPTTDPGDAWANARPVSIPALYAATVRELPDLFETTVAMFRRLRHGERFVDELARCLGEDDTFVYTSSTVDHLDEREIEKVFVLAREAGRTVAEDISTKLSWVAHEPADKSLRIRFSFGHEAVREWLEDDGRGAWAERFAERVFPECEIVTSDPDHRAILAELCGREVRLTERIVFNLVPGGGVTFHHDADPGQLGVSFAQFTGATVWLALPRAELAQALVEIGAAPSAAEARARLAEPDDALRATLNADPTLTAALADRDALRFLEPGDALLLPSHDAEKCCWHSVFGVGKRPGLAHSYAIYPLPE